ncbi:MAG: hypothetical protein M3380_16185, partial [Chloroflexota bacterium]|nr:hypothetical protein [Chloroflexota bacterium]
VNLQGEWVVQLEGLPVGQADAPDAAAVVLFAERARQVQHDFALSPADYPVVMRVCQLLEGMPLGIELAATWARVLSPTEIMAELERGLDFLEASTHDLPERHRSMRAVFEHSWRLLAPEEQQVLRRLTVFRGGFTRAAAKEVAGQRWWCWRRSSTSRWYGGPASATTSMRWCARGRPSTLIRTWGKRPRRVTGTRRTSGRCLQTVSGR